MDRFAVRHTSWADEQAGDDLTPTASVGLSAVDVVRELAPSCNSSVYTRLRREGINAAVDLVGLEKDDLRELGFTMLDRSRLLRWAREGGGSASAWSGGLGAGFGASMGVNPTSSRGATWSFASPIAESVEVAVRRRSSLQEAMMASCGGCGDLGNEAVVDTQSVEDQEAERLLDEVEQRAGFWCDLVAPRGSCTGSPMQPSFARSDRTLSFNEETEDLRENVLEGLFDLTSERVRHLYGKMKAGSHDGTVSLEELRKGLSRCGLPKLDDAALTRVIEAVGKARRHRGAAKTRDIQLAEFEAVLSRLKLAQLLTGSCPMPIDKETLGGRRTNLGSTHVTSSLKAIDYNTQKAEEKIIEKKDYQKFFFGHRAPQKLNEPPLVRWVHMNGLDLTLLLALTVKYSLHPLGVEDVIEQCPTKIDRYGSHYFAAIEQLCLASPMDGSEPVQVHGRHVAVFCSGPPLFDTILTITEPDHDEKEDWPGGSNKHVASSVGDGWVDRLKERLKATHSRLRERRADFLMYQILDLCSDELVKVAQAYTTRLSVLDGLPHLTPQGLAMDWLDEVQLAQLQLAVVGRRLKGLRRLLGRVLEDSDLTTGLVGYVSDVRDHVDEANEDVVYLSEKCRTILEAAERAVERHHNYCRQRADDRLNTMVFVLTGATALFAPVQFIAGVYGMNFAIDGHPSIPELLWPKGYRYFWTLVLTYLSVSSGIAVWLYRRFQAKQKRDLQASPGTGVRNMRRIRPGTSPLAPSEPSPTPATGGATPERQARGVDLGVNLGAPLLAGHTSPSTSVTRKVYSQASGSRTPSRSRTPPQSRPS